MQKTFAILIAVVSWFAVIAQFLLMMENRTASIPETIIRFFSFFTILTNTLVAIYFTARSLKLRLAYKRGVLTAVTIYIFMVGIVYQFLLRHLWHFTGLQLVVNELLLRKESRGEIPSDKKLVVLSVGLFDLYYVSWQFFRILSLSIR